MLIKRFNKEKWHSWYAWYPVTIDNDTRAWLCTVQRRWVEMVHTEYKYISYGRWEYKL